MVANECAHNMGVLGTPQAFFDRVAIMRTGQKLIDEIKVPRKVIGMGKRPELH